MSKKNQNLKNLDQLKWVDNQNPKRPSKPNNKKSKKIMLTERVPKNQRVESRNLLITFRTPLTTRTYVRSGLKENANTAWSALTDTTMSAQSRMEKSQMLINYLKK